LIAPGAQKFKKKALGLPKTFKKRKGQYTEVWKTNVRAKPVGRVLKKGYLRACKSSHKLTRENGEMWHWGGLQWTTREDWKRQANQTRGLTQ